MARDQNKELLESGKGKAHKDMTVAERIAAYTDDPAVYMEDSRTEREQSQ